MSDKVSIRFYGDRGRDNAPQLVSDTNQLQLKARPSNKENIGHNKSTYDKEGMKLLYKKRGLARLSSIKLDWFD